PPDRHVSVHHLHHAVQGRWSEAANVRRHLRRKRILETHIPARTRWTFFFPLRQNPRARSLLSQRRHQARPIQSAPELAAIGNRADRSARPPHADALRRAILVEQDRAPRRWQHHAGARRTRPGVSDEGELAAEVHSGNGGLGNWTL